MTVKPEPAEPTRFDAPQDVVEFTLTDGEMAALRRVAPDVEIGPVVKTTRFDAAEFLGDEDRIQAYIEVSRSEGDDEAKIAATVARAREMHGLGEGA